MKNKIIIVTGLLLCINSCRLPSSPLGEIKIIKRLETINTGGDCLDLDVDIEDSILVAAANYNGYFVYKINSKGGIVSGISEQNHISADADDEEMDGGLGDNRAQSVILSKKHNISFVMDQYDHVWLYKYEEGAMQYGPPNYMEEDCYGGVWLSVAIDDQSDRIGIYSLLKHNDADSSSGEFVENSTSLVWKNLDEVALESTSLGGEPDCEFIDNQGAAADKIYFSDKFLIQAYGELGVRVYQQTDHDICLVENLALDISDSLLCDFHVNDGIKDYKSCCENDICQGMDNCQNSDTYIEQNGYPGFGGKYSSAGGILGRVFAEFDTPGKVEALYSRGSTIFIGLSNSNGGMMSILNDDGSITYLQQFAIGYTIKGIHQDGDLLALAAGHDGILLYNSNEGNISFMGKIETSFANNVKVAGKIIFAATEDGIEIIQIDY